MSPMARGRRSVEARRDQRVGAGGDAGQGRLLAVASNRFVPKEPGPAWIVRARQDLHTSMTPVPLR
ncbi:MAG: hypothetical protein MZW92_30100 [Comamonadaceae bacterium]|nr:hypothetical protein [Comamonadaceae bacterium]